MLSSKANAALMRVKEMEEKYKMKRRKEVWNRKEDTDSSISSVSINFSENLSAKLKESPKNVSKLKLDIKMPDIRFEEDVDETKLSSKDKKSSNRASPKSEDADEVDLDVEMPLEDKSSHSAEKQESSISEVITIQEDSSIESVLDDSMTSSKSLSYSKVSQQNSSTTATSKLSGCKERIKVDGKLKKGKESDKSSEISRNKLSLNNSSIAKSSKLSERSKEKSSKVRSNVRQHLMDEEKIVKMKLISNDQNSKNLNRSELLRDDNVINELIDTIENGSEIISELSHAEESVVTNTEDVNLSINSHSVSENAYVMASNSSKHSIAENGYTNDTFEDVSSLTMRSKSELQRKKIIDAENMLIKLHGNTTDIMARTEVSSKIAKSSSRTKTELEDQNATMRKVKKEEENYHPSENDKISDHNSREYNTKKKKRKAVNTSAKLAKACNNIGSCKEDKALRLDEKQMRRLQKRIVELRLQQEREDLQKYLHELKDLKLQSSATPSYFSSLEFPKIVEFTQPDAIEIESKPDDQCVVLRERVSAIRRWLKDQYVLYRDYCTMAQAINAHYVPTTLDDAKKTIRKLRKNR